MDLAAYKEFKKEEEKKFLKGAQKIIAKEFEALFAKYPIVDALRWTQYTPHFNDGDECIFSRHEFYIRGRDPVSLIVLETEVADDNFQESWDIDKKSELSIALKDFENTFSSETEDLFKSAFGDGVMVTATRKGFDIEEQDHD